MNPQEIASAIESSWAEFITREEGREPHKRDWVYASGYSPCLRSMVLDMTHGDKLEPFPPEVLAKFRRGNDRERDLMVDLERVSRNCEPPFKVKARQEKYELRDHKSRKAISARVDGRLQFRDFDFQPPLEAKSWNPQITSQIETFEDVFKSPWTKRGGYQLLSYLLGAGEPYGFLLLDKPGLPALIPVELEPNYDRAEEFLMSAELAIDHKEAGTLPDFIEDPSECGRCNHCGVNCNPPLGYAGGEVILDPELESELERRAELEPASKEFKRIDKALKGRFRGLEKAVCGNFLLKGSWGKQIKYDVPEATAKEIEALREPHKKVDPEGRFTLRIKRL